jgi:hypothetical protein
MASSNNAYIGRRSTVREARLQP